MLCSLNEDEIRIIYNFLNLENAICLKSVCKLFYNLCKRKILTKPVSKVHTLKDLTHNEFVTKKNETFSSFNIIYKGRRRFETFTFQIGYIHEPIRVIHASYPHINVKFNEKTLINMNLFITNLKKALNIDHLEISHLITESRSTQYWNLNHERIYDPSYKWKSNDTKIIAIVGLNIRHMINKHSITFVAHEILFLEN